MTIEYCPRCQSYQIMRVTITKSVDTIARRINVGKTGMAAYVGSNGKVA